MENSPTGAQHSEFTHMPACGGRCRDARQGRFAYARVVPREETRKVRTGNHAVRHERVGRRGSVLAWLSARLHLVVVRRVTVGVELGAIERVGVLGLNGVHVVQLLERSGAVRDVHAVLSRRQHVVVRALSDRRPGSRGLDRGRPWGLGV